MLVLGLAWGGLAVPSLAQRRLTGVPPSGKVYTLGEGIVAKEVTFYSDDMPCWAKMFYPKGFDPAGKTPGVVLAHGWAGISEFLEKYGNRFAERGLVAMVIDYRGWGRSPGFVTAVDPIKTTDDQRVAETEARVRIKRTRLIPSKQVEDIRAAISYLQGEPGVDPDRIGIWGSSFAGGNTMVVASLDARVKAVVAQVPAIGGKNAPEGPLPLRGAALEDAIKRAREGRGGEYETGFSVRRMVDVETQQLTREYRPFHRVKHVPETVAVLFIVAGAEELFDNRENAYAAAEILKGPKEVVEIPNITHFEMYLGDAFERGSNLAAEWFRKHLGLD